MWSESTINAPVVGDVDDLYLINSPPSGHRLLAVSGPCVVTTG